MTCFPFVSEVIMKGFSTHSDQDTPDDVVMACHCRHRPEAVNTKSLMLSLTSTVDESLGVVSTVRRFCIDIVTRIYFCIVSMGFQVTVALVNAAHIICVTQRKRPLKGCSHSVIVTLTKNPITVAIASCEQPLVLVLNVEMASLSRSELLQECASVNQSYNCV